MTVVLDRPATQQTTVAPVFEAAILVIEEHGWTQGELFGASGYCVVGALAQAAYNLGWRVEGWGPDDGWGFLSSALGGRFLEAVLATDGDSAWCLVDWNDEPGRTKQEVVAKLRDAARRAREAD